MRSIPAKTPSGEHNPCPEAIAKHSWEHARSGGSYEWTCDEGCCGCAKDCGLEGCPTCPSERGPA
jgi:hypothetical protein